MSKESINFQYECFHCSHGKLMYSEVGETKSGVKFCKNCMRNVYRVNGADNMNSPKMRKVIDDVFEKLMAMPREQFQEEFDKHAKGDIYEILMRDEVIIVPLKSLRLIGEDGEEIPSEVRLETLGQVEGFLKAGRAGRESAEELKRMFGEKNDDV